MTDEIAKTARLMKVAEAVVDELDRQGVAEALAPLGSIRWRRPGWLSRRQRVTWSRSPVLVIENIEPSSPSNSNVSRWINSSTSRWVKGLRYSCKNNSSF